MIQFLKNMFFGSDKYTYHPEAIIVSCYFNPNNNPYRLKAFKKYYETIKHLEHIIIEAQFNSDDSEIKNLVKPQSYKAIKLKQLLWHKESLINHVVDSLDVTKHKYIFWVDADVIFDNKDWLVQSVEKLQGHYTIVQPFEFCYHLEKDQESIDEQYKQLVNTQYDNLITRGSRPKNVWRSFAFNWERDKNKAHSENYDTHGHVGFAWGARTQIVKQIPLFNKALTGGADHIIAHACVGQVYSKCIEKTFSEIIDEVRDWSIKFYSLTRGNLGYIKGSLSHIWHGDIEKRDYYNRVKNFTKHTVETTEEDGFHVVDAVALHVFDEYYHNREDTTQVETKTESFEGFGGGESGGAGASGSWEEDKPVEDNHHNNHHDNHSILNDSIVTVENQNFS